MKIYSNQFISENTINIPESGVITKPDEWWFPFDYQNRELKAEPIQLDALIRTQLSICVCNTLEECEEYISNQNLRPTLDQTNENY